MMNLLAKIRRRGIVYTIAIAFNRLMPVWLFRYTVIDVLEIDGDLVDLSTFGDRGSLRQMSSLEQRQSLRELTMVGDVDCSNEFPLGFGLSKANSGSGSEPESEKLVGGLWIGEQEHYEPSFGFKYVLPEDAGWLFAAMLLKEHRGKGDYNDLLVYSIRQAKRHGKNPIFLAVSPCHKAAVNAHGKFSSRKVGRVFGFKFFNWAWLSSNGDLQTKRSWTFDCKSKPNFLEIISSVPTDNDGCASINQSNKRLVNTDNTTIAVIANSTNPPALEAPDTALVSVD